MEEQKRCGLRAQVYEGLLAAADEKYREFHQGLLPGISGILGVRTPVLRRLAAGLSAGERGAYIEEMEGILSGKEGGPLPCYDERIIWGLCIGKIKSWTEAEPHVRAFVSAIDSWAVCDLICGSLKAAEKYQAEAWEFIQPYFKSEEEYEIRFGLVMLLSHFVKEEYLERALALIDQTSHPGYYARMGAAWALSIYFVHFPEQVMEYLRDSRLDDWTYNKALQKITESFRVDRETKAQIRSMRRKSTRALSAQEQL